MLTFKEYVNSDRTKFINPTEFAELHKIKTKTVDKSVAVVIDNDRLQHRSKIEYDGVTVGDILFFVNPEALGFTPAPDQVIVFDGVPSLVFDVRFDSGMYEIILKKNVS